MDIRREVLEFGLLPTGVLPARFDSISAVTDLHSKLLKETETMEGLPGYVRSASVRKLLKLTPDVWNVLFCFLHSVSCRSARAKWHLCSEDENRIDLHALSLFLFTQVYGRQVSRRTEFELQGSQREAPCGRGLAPRGLCSLTFSSFLRRNLPILLYLIKDNPPELSSPGWCMPRSPSSGMTAPPLHQDTPRGTIWISREEVDRLELLVKRRPRENGDVRRRSVLDGLGLASSLPCFTNYNREVFAAASSFEVATCLKALILDVDSDLEASGSGRICGMTKGTLVEGEDSFPDDQLVIHECQDSCIYALAPLTRAKITSCSDCIIVLGPTSGCVVVENCTRIKLIYAAGSTCISACHESILHLATTRSPYLLGENRFLRLAPFNIEYERLAAHLKMAEMSVTPNRWNQPVMINLHKELGREEDLPSVNVAVAGSASSNRVGDVLLPPEQLLPFTVPFKGGPGALAGGAPSNSQVSWVNRIGSGVGSGPSFPLDPIYAEALTSKLRNVAELQESVGKAISDLNNRRDVQVAIQRYFKEWLFKTAKIRQVYELAKLEQQMISETKSDNPLSSRSKNNDSSQSQ